MTVASLRWYCYEKNLLSARWYLEMEGIGAKLNQNIVGKKHAKRNENKTKTKDHIKSVLSTTVLTVQC